MDSVRAGPFGQLFRPDNFVFGQTGQHAQHAIKQPMQRVVHERRAAACFFRSWQQLGQGSGARSLEFVEQGQGSWLPVQV